MKLINSENFVDEAEKVIKELTAGRDAKGRAPRLVTTSKIRNLLSMASDLYNEVLLLKDGDLGEPIKGQISYLRVRCVYEAGRDESVSAFIRGSHLLEILPSIKDRADYLLFSRYMEALVAWHRYYGGKDN